MSSARVPMKQYVCCEMGCVWYKSLSEMLGWKLSWAFYERDLYKNKCFVCWQERPYHDDSTASRLLSEVKHHRAQLVLRWGTTLESCVLFFAYWRCHTRNRGFCRNLSRPILVLRTVWNAVSLIWIVGFICSKLCSDCNKYLPYW